MEFKLFHTQRACPCPVLYTFKMLIMVLCFHLGTRRASGYLLESARKSQSKHQDVLCDGFYVCIVYRKIIAYSTP